MGLLLGIGGTGIVLYKNAFHHTSTGFLGGVGLSLCAMLSWSAGTLIIARNKLKINPYHAIGWQMLLSSVVLLFISIASKDIIPVAAISFKAWMAIAYLVIAGSVISFIAFIYSMKKLPAAVFSLYAYFNPMVAILAGAIFLKEKLTVHILWGAVVTLPGVFLVNYSLKKDAKRISEKEER